jgi:hypothetical protein
MVGKNGNRIRCLLGSPDGRYWVGEYVYCD